MIGNPCLRWLTVRLRNKCGIGSMWQLLMDQGLVLIHKVLTNKQPKTIYNLFKDTDRPNRQTDNKIYTKYIPKTTIMKKFMIYKNTDIYNSLESQTLTLDIRKF